MTQEIKNQLIGVCRFSYLGDGGFIASGRKQDELEAHLYGAERMLRRFAFFEAMCLPSLAAQTDQNFTLVALIGDTMPYRWRRKLKNLMDVYPFLQICTLEAAGPLNSTRRAFRRATDNDADFVTGFRIDDDDAVAIDYIGKTRAMADHLLAHGFADANNPAVIAYHHGLYWDLNDHEAPFYDFSETAPLGLASAMITPADMQTNIFRWNHRRLAAHCRCWLDPTERMFVRTLHRHNDSDRSIPPGSIPVGLPKARRILEERFGLDTTKVIPLMWRKKAAPEE
jgi:hypothetical protein